MNKNIIALISVIFTSLYPIFFMYFINVDEVSFRETLLPTVIFMVVGLGGTLVTGLISKSLAKGSTGGILLVLLFSNYALIEKGIHLILPQLKYWHIISILIVLILHLIYIISKHDHIAQKINLVSTVIFGGLILFNFAISIPQIIETNSFSTEKIEKKLNVSQNNVESPNVYYFIYDEYSSLNVMKKYYDYNNSAFFEYLSQKGFNVSHDSYNDSNMTTTVVANYMNLKHVANDDMTESEKKELRQNGSLIRIMQEKGYSIRGIGSSGFFGIKSLTEADNSNSQTVEGITMYELIMGKTAYYPFLNKDTGLEAQNILASFNYFKNQNIYDEKSTFTFCYVRSPHQPFLFDEKGNLNASNLHNWKDKEYYLDQYIYITSLIEQEVENILKSDPDSIIILQSDHSARYLTDENDNYVIDTKDKRNILNAVYYKGENLQIEGQSGVDTVKAVVDRMFEATEGGSDE